MLQEKFCQSCEQKDHCKDVYRQLGNAQTPSVFWKVVFAFLLPLLVFTAVLAALEHILAKLVSAEQLRTGISFVLALVAAFVFILITKAIDKKRCKNR